MKKAKYVTNNLFIIGIICFVSLLSLMPFMHVHDHCNVHHDCNEHHESEPKHTDESCPACVFLNVPVTFQVPPITLVTNYLYIETLPLTEVSSISFNPPIYIQSRAPPTFSN